MQSSTPAGNGTENDPDQSTPSISSLTPEQSARMKAAARDNRFSFRNLAEHQLRRELKDVAMDKCKPQISEFAECSQTAGLMVVYSCRHLFKNVNECMSINNGDEAWEKYKILHQDEIDRRATLQKRM
jgi:Cytochrome c oxidase biogenesis protein Cmc1 like